MMPNSKQEFARKVSDTLQILEQGDSSISKNYIKTYFYIMAHPRKNLTSVRQDLNISQATMWRIIDKFEELGMGKKVQDSFDHKIYYFKMHQKGNNLIEL
ncbi:MAG: hypothetical protein ACOCRK_11060 [bacterium]